MRRCVPKLAGQEPDCGDRAALRVVILDESESIPIPGATLVLRWTETDQVRRPLRQDVEADGGLVLCAPPDARRATLWAEFGDASSEEAVVGITPGTLHDVELRLRTASVTTGRLIGEVRDAVTDRPVAAAAISVVGGTAVAETNRRGNFILSGVPVGIHELAVRRLGYAPVDHTVAVLRGCHHGGRDRDGSATRGDGAHCGGGDEVAPTGDQGLLRAQVLG